MDPSGTSQGPSEDAFRTLPLEQATDPAHVEKLRTELVERARRVGAVNAERILVTDFVIQ
jgi:hypothetical protein